MGDVTRLGKQKLADKDFVGLGELMNINQGLLESIGVSDDPLSRLVYAAEPQEHSEPKIQAPATEATC